MVYHGTVRMIYYPKDGFPKNRIVAKRSVFRCFVNTQAELMIKAFLK